MGLKDTYLNIPSTYFKCSFEEATSIYIYVSVRNVSKICSNKN